MAKGTRKPDEKKLPLQLLFGWLPKVGVKDAKTYMQGLADKHCQNPAATGYLLLPFDSGWAFEVQEGGDGTAFLPSILQVFQEARKADTPLEEVERFVIETAGRKLQLEMQQEGFTTVRLPESSTASASAGLEATTALTPLLPERRGVLFTGIGIFTLGVLALTVATLWRYQPQLSPAPQVISTARNAVPLDQWNALVATQPPPGMMITKLEYKDGKWDIVKGSSE